uniref:Rpn11/EIF3F C-terminal domain-containing protein n=1 Tax=Globodera rostochiensis TaxID=31243 RepID=A0A914HWC0_GLORO
MCPHYHGYYTGLVNETPRKEPPPIILITMDVTFSGETADRLPIKAYTAREAGIPGKSGSQATVFYPLNVETDVFTGESVALSFIMKGLDSERREVKFASGQEQLLENGEQLVDWLEKMLIYVKKVLDGKEVADPTIGRKLMEIVSLARTQLSAEKMKSLVEHSFRDYLMVSLLANLAKTQLALQEKVTLT